MVRSIKNLIAAVLISISGFMVWTNILPKYDNSSQIKLAIEAKKIVLESRTAILEKVRGLQNEYEQRYAELQRLGLIVPKEKSLPELISTIEDISSKTGIIFNAVSVTSGGASATDPFNVINFDTNFETSYESLLNFLGYLERNLRLIDVNALSMGLKSDDLTSEPGLLEIQVKTTMYYLKPLEEIQALKQVPVKSAVE